MSTKNKTSLRSRIDLAWSGLRQAEALRDMLAANPLPGNGYYDDAMQRADELVGEMHDDVDWWIAKAIESGYGPEDFE